jgi:hypothetical protein
MTVMRTRNWRRLKFGGTRTPLPRAVIALMTLFTFGCASSVSNPTALRGSAAGSDIPEHALLDVQILAFDPGVPDVDEQPSSTIRRAEARYFPCLLRQTLTNTGQWGAVDVAAHRSDGLELILRGRIVHSNGEKLEIDIEAHDAAGRRWLAKRYAMETDEEQFEDMSQDPYQPLFNSIANDLAAKRAELLSSELRDIRATAALRFAEDFAPDAFSGYLEKEKNEVRIVRLPARDDPMSQLLAEVRGREAMLFATQSGQFEDFCTDMSKPYGDWRKLTREEGIAARTLRRQAILRRGVAAGLITLTLATALFAPPAAAVVATTAGMWRGWSRGDRQASEAQFHKDTLEELDRGFQAELEPMMVAMDGRIAKLTGVIDRLRDEWRRLLQELYRVETSASHDLDITTRADSAQGAPGGIGPD